MSIANKFGPKTMRDIVVENADTKQRLEDYAVGLRTGHVLIYGPKGTGKSSAARVISETRTGGGLGNCADPYEGATFKESDLAKILSDWNWQMLNEVKVPVTVINEVDLLSAAMREQLKAFMDERGHIGQIIGTTNSEHRLSHAQQDRFDMIEMPALSAGAFVARGCEMATANGVNFTEDEMRTILNVVDGSWRDAVKAIEDVILAVKRN